MHQHQYTRDADVRKCKFNFGYFPYRKKECCKFYGNPKRTQDTMIMTHQSF